MSNIKYALLDTDFISKAHLINKGEKDRLIDYVLQWKGETHSFVAWSYIIATVFSMLLYLFFKAKGDGITFKIKPSVFIYSLSVGVILGVFQLINTKAIANINGTLLFPTYNAGTLILSTLSSILILKDKLTNNQKISIFIGIVAIVLMNI